MDLHPGGYLYSLIDVRGIFAGEGVERVDEISGFR